MHPHNQTNSTQSHDNWPPEVYDLKHRTRLIISTYWLDEDVPDSLPVVPLAHAASDLLQKVLVVLQDLWDLVEHLVHEQRVHYGAAVGLFERTHVALRGEPENPVNILTQDVQWWNQGPNL